MTSSYTKPIALTIAGSDCSGGAGIQADLKTFSAHEVYGMTVVTSVVAENPRHVVAIHPVPVSYVKDQLICCLKGMPSISVKTGMLYSASIIQTVLKTLGRLQTAVGSFVVDPVMVATSGKHLLRPDAIRALKKLIQDRADLVTPNLHEAEILAEQKIQTEAEMEIAAKKIHDDFHCAVLLKGGHLKNSRWAKDFFWDGKQGCWFRSPRIAGVKTHGTGCTYSAAIVANLAKGYSLQHSIRQAKIFVTNAIRQSHRISAWTVLYHEIRRN